MIVFKGRDPITHRVIIEHNGKMLDVFKNPDRGIKGIRPLRFAQVVLQHCLELPVPRPRGSTRKFADRYLPNRPTILPGYTISDEREAELKEAATTIMVECALLGPEEKK